MSDPYSVRSGSGQESAQIWCIWRTPSRTSPSDQLTQVLGWDMGAVLSTPCVPETTHIMCQSLTEEAWFGFDLSILKPRRTEVSSGRS